jgi:hypothetical protein
MSRREEVEGEAMKVFGNAWWPDDVQRTETPAGQVCQRCHEAIAAGDAGVIMPYYNGQAWYSDAWHRECYLRMVVGSVGHQLGRCSCHGGTEEDPAGMTTREAARAALLLFEERRQTH